MSTEPHQSQAAEFERRLRRLELKVEMLEKVVSEHGLGPDLPPAIEKDVNGYL